MMYTIFIFYITELYSTTECIRSQKEKTRTRFQTTEPYTHQMQDEIVELSSVYKQEDKEHLFLHDMDLLLDTYRTSGYSDYFLRSLQASISSQTKKESEFSKPQVLYINGFSLGVNQTVICLPQCS